MTATQVYHGVRNDHNFKLIFAFLMGTFESSNIGTFLPQSKLLLAQSQTILE